MNINEKFEKIMALSNYEPRFEISIKSRRQRVEIEIEPSIVIGNTGYFIEAIGVGDSFEEALNMLYSRLVETDEKIYINSGSPECVCVKFQHNNWVKFY